MVWYNSLWKEQKNRNWLGIYKVITLFKKGGKMKNNVEKFTNNIFESIKHIDNYGNEYWYARELSNVL